MVKPFLCVYRKPRRNRFKVYLVWYTTQRRERRVAIGDQPFHGFATLIEAFAFMEKVDESAAVAAAHMCKGTKPPPDEQRIRRTREQHEQDT